MSGGSGGSDPVEVAFRTHRRRDFLPVEVRRRAASDRPLSLGHGQTNSQPTTVRMMLAWLDARPGQRVLDVGSGSGWTTALLASIVGPTGHVDAVERIPALVEMGRANGERAGLVNATFHLASERLGLAGAAPFARVLVSAAADTLPSELVDQVTPGGRLVIPVRHDVLVVDVDLEGQAQVVVHRGFRFVPLIT